MNKRNHALLRLLDAFETDVQWVGGLVGSSFGKSLTACCLRKDTVRTAPKIKLAELLQLLQAAVRCVFHLRRGLYVRLMGEDGGFPIPDVVPDL